MRGDDTVACDLFFRENDIDYLVAVAHDVDAFDAFHVEQFPTDVFGIAIHFGVIVSIGGQGIEDTIYVYHVVDDHRVVAPLWQAGYGVVYLAA